jgi:hypothetical protein
MPTDPTGPKPAASQTGETEEAGKRQLAPAAQRALAEAAARRAASAKAEPPEQPAKEVGGRSGPDPARYGDWEINGLASDF